jgi:poly-gamma-glutamate capsule biosynthesis protein CapA/YwtB (metallophosphatase superfamily)
MTLYQRRSLQPLADRKLIRLFLSGDVMIGRGIDQILPHPCPPRLHEDYVSSAVAYVEFAEQVSGRIQRPVGFDYIWGAALDSLREHQPDARIVNLETSITCSEDYEPKGINYRVSPANAECLRAAGIDCCALANNHVLDWGETGLVETLEVLDRMGVKTVGAGRNFSEAKRSAILDIAAKGRVILEAFALPSSGAPPDWAASGERAGVNLLPELSTNSAARVCDLVRSAAKTGDISVVSIHWGPNWGYEIPDEQRRFAHKLVDEAGVSVVHGHSSHHAKAIEVYRNRLILYGCGDFLNDYEGIQGYEEYRADLSLMYFVDVDPTSGDLVALGVTPLQIRRFRLEPAASIDAEWIARRLDRESAKFGVRVEGASAQSLTISWL